MSGVADAQPRRHHGMRLFVLVAGGVLTLAMAFVVGAVVSSGQLSSGEGLSRSMGWAVIAIYGTVWAACVLPALILATANRLIPLALFLCLLTVPVFLAVFHYA